MGFLDDPKLKTFKTIPHSKECGFQFMDIIKNCKLEVIKRADHKYSNPKHFEKMLKLISNFIIKNSK